MKKVWDEAEFKLSVQTNAEHTKYWFTLLDPRTRNPPTFSGVGKYVSNKLPPSGSDRQLCTLNATVTSAPYDIPKEGLPESASCLWEQGGNTSALHKIVSPNWLQESILSTFSDPSAGKQIFALNRAVGATLVVTIHDGSLQLPWKREPIKVTGRSCWGEASRLPSCEVRV